MSFDVSFQGAANQTESNFTEQMALNQLDTEKLVRMEYVANTEFVPRSTMLTIDGYGTRIPAFGSVAAAYHTPGAILRGMSNTGNQNVRTGLLDDRIVAHASLDEYDAKQRATINFQPARLRELGMAIAEMDETQAAIMAVLASRASATVTSGPVGGAVAEAGASINVTSLLSLIWSAKTALDQNKVSQFGRSLGLSPTLYNLLVGQLPHLSSRDLGNDGSMSERPRLPYVAGFEVFPTLYLPSTNISSATTGQRNTYTGNFIQTIGVAFHKEATATLIPASELPMGGKGNVGINSNDQLVSPIQIRSVGRQDAFAELSIASLITGHCVVRPECAIELKDSALS